VEDCPNWEIDEPEPDVLSRAEIARLLAACRDPYHKSLERKARRPTEWKQEFRPPEYLYGVVLVAVHTLLRLGNVLGLKWGSVDLEEGKIVIGGEEVKTKRALEIPLTATLRDYFAGRERGAPAAYVFVNPETGDRFAPDALKRSFRSAATRAGLPGLRFHTLRKSGATILLESGVPLHVVQRIGGWKKPDVLLRFYASATTKEKAKAIKVLDRLGG